MEEKTQKGIIGIIGAFIICASVLLAAMLIGFTRVIQVEKESTLTSLASAKTLTQSDVEQLDERIAAAQKAIAESRQSRSMILERAETVEKNSAELAAKIDEAKGSLSGRVGDIDDTYAIVEGLKTMMQIESRTVTDWKNRLDTRVQDVENIEANIDDRSKRLEVIENSKSEYDDKYDELIKLYDEKDKEIQPIYGRVEEIDLKSASNKSELERVKTIDAGFKERLDAVEKRLKEIGQRMLAQTTYQRVPGKRVFFLSVTKTSEEDPKQALLTWSEWFRSRGEFVVVLVMFDVDVDAAVVENEWYETRYEKQSRTLLCTVKRLNEAAISYVNVDGCFGWTNEKYGMATFCVLVEKGIDTLVEYVEANLRGYDVHVIGGGMINSVDKLKSIRERLASGSKLEWFASTEKYGDKVMGYVGTGKIVANEHFDKYNNSSDSVLLVEQRYTF